LAGGEGDNKMKPCIKADSGKYSLVQSLNAWLDIRFQNEMCKVYCKTLLLSILAFQHKLVLAFCQIIFNRYVHIWYMVHIIVTKISENEINLPEIRRIYLFS
jgi:hypothetical protein